MTTQEQRGILFFAFIPGLEVAGYIDSLEALSGYSMALGPDDFRSNVTETVAQAWSTAICDLSCAQVRVLVGQKMGLKWLAEPVAQFIKNNPAADIDFYPGDLTLAALRAFEEISAHSQKAATLIRSADFSWIESKLDFEPELVAEAKGLVEALG